MSAPSPARAAEPLLSVRDLVVHYGVIRALSGISLEVRRGQVVALIGANGAGKTTTLRAVSGMVRPTAGAIAFQGEPLAALPPHAIVARGLAQAPEGRGIFLNLTVKENLDLGAYLRRDRDGIEADRERSYALFPILRERLHQVSGTLSGGEQQMLAVARALMSRPTLLLLDEPSLGLAPQVVERIFQVLRDVNAAGVSILLVEQNAHKALRDRRPRLRARDRRRRHAGHGARAPRVPRGAKGVSRRVMAVLACVDPGVVIEPGYEPSLPGPPATDHSCVAEGKAVSRGARPALLRGYSNGQAADPPLS